MKFNVEAGTFNIDDDIVPDDPESVRAANAWIGWIISIFIMTIVVEVIALVILLKFSKKLEKPDSVKTLVVLGSGGHTAEMMRLVESLDKTRYTPRAYVVAETDKMSGRKASDYENMLSDMKAIPGKRTFSEVGGSKNWELFEIPRSREVGQSYVTSIWTTLRAFLHALALVWQVAPQVVLVNGPGTCIPVCFAAVLYRLVAAYPCKIMYIESIARTQRLSLSGKILYHTRIADLLCVQWKELGAKYPRAKFAGRLY
ncbi:hypothetical protein CEUSTIGMA_g1630.t1 [Chlamydomonas eustigma]|uniref:UDP-N-acetylglucosamine transferase subunit ALG14 n=1 Tax=Chlamydomonas eustigma TaxID=1157962 RepID=A0A250WTN2_9CHLO|nr:hypothetical protein CEUSTIGMA_g1630.t1 [Chlamydomonas eustigma]|eukprot:GAX74181.1 hypothetical protein CEUSTIGMA_g1630.t1 [Chlamydomonas eustigma]